MIDSTQRLNVRQQTVYALPAVGALFLLGPISLLQGIYTTYFGVTLTAMASALLIARLFDAVTDPLVGYLSDRQYARSGSRNGFILGGGLLLIISSYFLYVPIDPELVGPSSQVSISYFLIGYSAFYLGYTLFTIPHMARGSDLATNTQDKNSIFGIRAAMGYLGLLLFYAIPLLPFFDTTEITPDTLYWAAVGGAVLLLPTLYIYSAVLPRSDRKTENSVKKDVLNNSRLQFRQAVGNKPLLIFLASYLFYGLWFGMFWSMSFIFVNSYLVLGEYYALVIIAHTVTSLVSLKLWAFLSSRLNKSITWVLGVSLNAIGVLMLAILQPGGDSVLPLLIAYILIGCGVSASEVMVPSVLSDIIDYHKLKFKADCSASIYSLYMLMIKINFAVGGALVFFVAGWYGFNPAEQNHSLEAVFGLRAAVVWMPTIFVSMAILLILKIPITARRYAIIRRGIDKRSLRDAGFQKAMA